MDDGKLLAYPELDDGKGDFKSEGKVGLFAPPSRLLPRLNRVLCRVGMGEQKNSKDKDPLSLILSEFHFLLLTKVGARF